MISFNIIGYNEGQRLHACIESIRRFISLHAITANEIIYVDSKSTDSSIEIACSFPDVKVFRITGETNAAVGRNVAASESKGDVLFFIDGDMEIEPGVYNDIFDENNRVRHNFMSGQFMNVYYNESGDVDNTELYHKSVLTGDRYQTTTGGLFVVTRHLWEQMRGMRTKYTTGEDLDFGLRIARSGTLLLRRQNLWAMHHTVHYKSFSRMWSDLFHGRNLYARAVLYRNHLFNRHMYARMIKRDPTVVVLILCTLLSLYTHRYNLLILYPFILGIIFGFILKVDTVKEFFNRILYQILRDLMTILGFFFFFPCEKTIAYQKIQ